jgi:hypothetical protein
MTFRIKKRKTINSTQVKLSINNGKNYSKNYYLSRQKHDLRTRVPLNAYCDVHHKMAGFKSARG